MAVAILVAFGFVFYRVFRVFTPRELRGQGGWQIGRYKWAYIIMLPALATIAGVPIALGYYLVPNPYVALLIGVGSAIAAPMYLGPSFAMTQTLVKPHMRAMASAILLFVLNIVGLGLGPLAVGFMNDRLDPSFGQEAIRYSLLVVSVIGASSAIFFQAGSRTLRDDLVS